MNNTKIRAAVCRQFGKPLQIETLFLAPPKPHQVQVKLEASSICHSDIIYMDGLWGGQPPLVLGHEGAGIVVAAGADTAIDVGSRVIVTLIYSCRHCNPCQQGVPALCDNPPAALDHLSDANGNPVGVGLKTGAFAEQVVVDASQVAIINDNLAFNQACLLACGVITGWGAVTNIAKMPGGCSAAVVGCGGVGVNCLQAAALSGASPLVAIDLSEEKLQLVKQFGVTHTLQAQSPDIFEQVKQITGSNGFDYVYMAAGSSKAVELAVALVDKMGTLVVAGMTATGDIPKIDTTTLAEKQAQIMGSKMGGTRLSVDIPRLQRLHSEGRLKLKELIAGTYTLDNINDAIAATRTGDALRQVIVFPQV